MLIAIPFRVLSLGLVLMPAAVLAQTGPTAGWSQVEPFDYYIQRPHDLPLSDRYRFDAATNTHTMWALRGDKPHTTSSNTAPRTEMRFRNDYRTGEHMFDADLYVVGGTHSCVMQIFGATQSATTVILMAHPDGTIRYYDGPDFIRRNAYDTWWNLKVSHNTEGNGTIRFYVNDQLVLTKSGRGRTTHYFKTGVYSVRNGNRSENRVRNVKYWVRGTRVSILPVKPPEADNRRLVAIWMGGADVDPGAWSGSARTGGLRNLMGRRVFAPELAHGPYLWEPADPSKTAGGSVEAETGGNGGS